jgi:sulfur-oxidizing protein SoxZ
MTQPMRLRAQVQDGKVVVRVLMAHEMETGLRKDAAGNIVPAWYIQEVSATLNGKLVMSAEWSMAISKNPFLRFSLPGAKAGDRIAVAWVDNRGERRTDEVTVA